jgi:hypothetical protein
LPRGERATLFVAPPAADCLNEFGWFFAGLAI